MAFRKRSRFVRWQRKLKGLMKEHMPPAKLTDVIILVSAVLDLLDRVN